MGFINEGVRAKWDSTCEWIDEHKVEVIVGLGLVLVIIGGVLIVKNGSPIKSPIIHELSKGAANTTSKLTQIASENIMNANERGNEFLRSGYVRKLHEGMHASAAKIAEAAEKGIKLQNGETLVDACTVLLKGA